MRYINAGLYGEIRSKLDYLKGKEKSKIVLGCRNIRDQKIKESARINSFRMEYPSTDSLPLIDSNSEKRKFMKRGIEHLEIAYDWAREHFNPQTLY